MLDFYSESKVDKTLKENGINIRADNGNFKTLYQVMEELSIIFENKKIIGAYKDGVD